MKPSSDPTKDRETINGNLKGESDVRQTIATLAYKFSEERRGEGGSPLDDWLKAERLVQKHLAHQT